MGWLEDSKTGDIRKIDILEPLKANKVNLNKKNNFVIAATKYYDRKLYYDLYLYVDDTNIKCEKIKEYSMKTEYYDKTFEQDYRLTKVVIKDVEFELKTMLEHRNIIKEEQTKRKDTVTKVLNDLNISLTDYDIAKMLQKNIFNEELFK